MANQLKMAPVGWSGHMRLPEFYADTQKYPNETWADYERGIQLAYDGAGVTNLDPKVKRAHLLAGLKGQAQLYLRYNPQLQHMEYPEVLQQLRNHFDRPNWHSFGNIGTIVQKPNESVAEYVHRLREAAKMILPEEVEYTAVTKKEAKSRTKEDESVEAVPESQVQREAEMYASVVDKFIFRFFLHGLKEELKQTVLNSETTSLRDAIIVAEKREHYL